MGNGLGRFASGALSGYLVGLELKRREEDLAFKREERERTRKQWAADDQLRAALSGGLDSVAGAASGPTDGPGAGPSRPENAAARGDNAPGLSMPRSAFSGDGGGAAAEASAGLVEPVSRVPGLGTTTDPAFARRMAEDESFATGQEVKPQSAYRVPGRGVYGAPEDAIAQASDVRSEAAMLARNRSPGGEGPGDRLAFDAYMRRKAPQILDAYLKQGKFAEAKVFRDFLDSEEGRSYATQWSRGVRKHAVGDFPGALGDWQQLYNDQLYNDGRTVKLHLLDDGQNVQAEFFNPDGTPAYATKPQPIGGFAAQAGMALAPEKLVEFRANQEVAAAKETAAITKALALEDARQRGQEARDDRRDERLQMRLDAQNEALDRKFAAQGQRPKLSAAQEARNIAIEAARRRVEGLSAEEIRRHTAKATATGRENPHYDETLARSVALAGRRKVGEDPWFDAQAGLAQGDAGADGSQVPRAPTAGGDVASRFRSDPAMAGHTLGKATDAGVEVLKDGKLVGHYR